MLEPFAYAYMTTAMGVGGLTGLVCGILSAYLVLKGWSLIGDALAHSVVPGVAVAYALGLPFALGAFVAGALAAGSMLLLSERSGLKTDVVIGIIFTGFFGLGLFLVSLNPTSVDVQSIVMGNILAIAPADTLQLVLIGGVCLAVVGALWRDLLVAFFDEAHARAVGLRPRLLKGVFFALLSAAVVAALQTVGAFLVIAMVVTPGATAYLLTDRFGRMVLISGAIGGSTAVLGTYASYFLDGATGGMIVLLQTALFVLAVAFAPVHGIRAARRRARTGAAAPGANAAPEAPGP